MIHPSICVPIHQARMAEEAERAAQATLTSLRATIAQRDQQLRYSEAAAEGAQGTRRRQSELQAALASAAASAGVRVTLLTTGQSP